MYIIKVTQLTRGSLCFVHRELKYFRAIQGLLRIYCDKMEQFIEESKNTLAELVTIKDSVAVLDPNMIIQKVDPSKRILRLH